MRIMRFTGKQIYGYMDFDIRFNNDLSFLTGINGSGKTTIVQCLYALISPSVRVLSNMEYDFIEVAIKINGQAKYVRIKATKEESEVTISTNMTSQLLSVPILQNIEPRTSVEEDEYYNDFLTKNSDNEVLKYIRELPSPMFLGIERRTVDESVFSRRPMTFTARRRLRPNISTYNQRQSLLEARDLARDSYSEVRGKVMLLMETLRTQILLSALKFVNVTSFEFSKVKEIIGFDMETTTKMIINITEELGIPTESIQKELKLFVDDVSKAKAKLVGDIKDEKKLRDILTKDPDKAVAFYSLFVNMPHFNRITTIFRHVQDYITNSQTANEPINQYRDIVNSFFKDSGKTIHFDTMGNIFVSIDDVQDIPITSLSSGESQILIMISHLIFNPGARDASVIIIDEPELSLHVAWQELFVESLQKANPDLQIILATHAPSIILDRLEKCIELGK